MQRKFIYFPSFSVGNFGQAMVKNEKLNNDIPYRFYDPTFPKKFRHPYFLVTAGHFYKKENYYKDAGFDLIDDIVVMGDSGGYQIASGAVKKENFSRELILRWLENNSHVAMNLDIPPRLKYDGKFNEALEISIDNFNYFSKNRTPNNKTEFLNVIQGNDEYTYKLWYDSVKHFEFNGWGMGGAGLSIYRFMSCLVALMQGKEQYKDNNKWLHILGASKVIDFLLLSQLQKSLNDINSNMQVTTDSSSPSRAVVYGYYYYDYDLKNCTFKSIHIPKELSQSNQNKTKHSKNTISESLFHLPSIIEFDKYLEGAYNYEDITRWTTNGYAAVILHNFMFYNKTIDDINEWVNGNEYILEQVTNSDTFLLLKSIDEMVKAYENGSTPEKVFAKYKNLYIKLSSKEVVSTGNVIHNFFI